MKSPCFNFYFSIEHSNFILYPQKKNKFEIKIGLPMPIKNVARPQSTLCNLNKIRIHSLCGKYEKEFVWSFILEHRSFKVFLGILKLKYALDILNIYLNKKLFKHIFIICLYIFIA